jgi:hypothetical protein
MRKKEINKLLGELERACYSIVGMANENAQLRKEVDCAEDYGHEYVFEEKSDDLTVSKIYMVRDAMNGVKYKELDYAEFTYKCSRCGRTVDYTWDELSTKEKNALKTLGVVKP